MHPASRYNPFLRFICLGIACVDRVERGSEGRIGALRRQKREKTLLRKHFEWSSLSFHRQDLKATKFEGEIKCNILLPVSVLTTEKCLALLRSLSFYSLPVATPSSSRWKRVISESLITSSSRKFMPMVSLWSQNTLRVSTRITLTDSMIRFTGPLMIMVMPTPDSL